MRASHRRLWAGTVVVLLLLLMVVMLVRTSSPRQPGMPGTGTINYGTPVSPGNSPASPAPSSMPGMEMGGSGGK